VTAAPVRLQPHHVTTDFRCGSDSLDSWLTHHALRADRERTAVTFVACDDERVMGYYCLSSHSVARESIGGGWLAHNAPNPVPVVLLGRLAVDRRAQGHGLGWSLLQHAIAQSLVAGEVVGMKALVVDPLDEDAAAFYTHFGFKPFPSTPARLFIPLRR
jgi:GNAT superfamily N-acetyltransferase